MTEAQQRVNTLIERVERYQAALRLNDSRFVGRFQRHLGSTRTWRERLCGRSWDEIPLGKWEKKLAKFVAEIEGTSRIAGFLAEMPIAAYGQALYDTLQGQQSDRRVAWLVGPTGVGKSWTMQWLHAENVETTAFIHVNRGARESMMCLARQFARAVGASEESSASATFGNVVDALTESALTLMIDDVHEGGVLALKLIKHLVDDSRGKFMLGTYPTAWAQLVNGSTDAHSEAQQLIGRSIKPVERRWVAGLGEKDIAAFLRLSLGGNGECEAAAERLAPVLRRNGNLRALADAIELAQMNADDTGGEVSIDMVVEAVRELCPGEKR